MSKIKLVEESQKKKEIPKFKVGDTVRVFVRIVEEEKTRIQPFEGVVIRKKGRGSGESFTVRRVSFGEGTEKTFPTHSPAVEKITVTKPAKTRRSKLYHLRKKA